MRVPVALLAAALLAAPAAPATGAEDAGSEGYDARVRALAERIESREANARLARRVAARRVEVAADPAAAARTIRARLDALRLVLVRVPGLFYRSHPDTGADLAVLERLLGAPVPLLETDEVGTVEANARRVAERLPVLADGGRAFVVSASKGSADVRAALEREDGPGDAVAAWLDLVGVLEGTPLTDPDVPWADGVARWLPGDTARSLSRAVRRPRVAPERFPPGTLAVHVAALPLAGDVSAEARPGFERLRSLGPNDGYVLLEPLLRAPGRVWLARGADHYLRVDAIADRLAALLLVMLDELSADAAGSSDEKTVG